MWQRAVNKYDELNPTRIGNKQKNEIISEFLIVVVNEEWKLFYVIRWINYEQKKRKWRIYVK